jgi:hypothetical protein
VDKWSMYFITYLPLKARMLFGECGSVSRWVGRNRFWNILVMPKEYWKNILWHMA